MGENAIKISYDFQLAFFLIQHPLDGYKTLTVLHSFDSVGLDSFCLFFDISKVPTWAGT